MRFRLLNGFYELVLNRQSDFSPKEIYYPISQTLFRFDENSYIPVLPVQTKPVLIFAHPCDLNAVCRLDNIFLKNGGQADPYYEALRGRVKFGLLECRESGYENCFCVSMGANKTEDYAMAILIDVDGIMTQINDSSLLPCFAGNAECNYAPAFVVDAMTAEIEPLDYALLARITKRITSEAKDVNRVLYDLTPKPTGTIEWE